VGHPDVFHDKAWHRCRADEMDVSLLALIADIAPISVIWAGKTKSHFNSQPNEPPQSAILPLKRRG